MIYKPGKLKYFGVFAFVLMLVSALLQAGGDGTSVMVVILSALIFIPALVKDKKV